MIVLHLGGWNVNAQQDSIRLGLPLGHTGQITSLTYSHNQRLIMTTGDHTIAIWDAKKGNLIRLFSGHNNDISNAMFNKDDSQILSYSNDGEVILWNVFTGAKILSFDNKDGLNNIRFVCFSPDEKYIYTTTIDLIRLWDAQTGVLKRELNLGSSKAIFLENGKEVVSLYSNGIFKWNIGNYAEFKSFHDDEAKLEDIIWDSNDNHFIVGTEDGNILIFDENLKQIPESEVKQYPSFNFKHTSIRKNKKLTIKENNLIEVEELQSKRKLYIINLEYEDKSYSDFVPEVHFTEDEQRIITRNPNDPLVKVWDATTGKLIAQLNAGFYDPYSSVSVLSSLDNQQLVTISYDGVDVWNMNSLKKSFTLINHASKFSYAAFNSKKNKIVSSTKQDSIEIQVWEFPHLLKNKNFSTIPPELFETGFNNHILVEDNDHLKIFDIDKEQLSSIISESSSQISYAKFDSLSQRLLTITGNNRLVKLWNLKENTSRIIDSLSENEHFISGDFSPNHDKILIIKGSNFDGFDSDFTVKVWDIERQDFVFDSVIFHSYGPSFVKSEFSPNGRTIFVFNYNNGKKISIDANTGKVIEAFGYDYQPEDPLDENMYFPEKLSGVMISSTGAKSATFFERESDILVNNFDKNTEFYLKGHQDQINSGSFNEDETKLVTASKDNTSILWDLNSIDIISHLVGHTANVVTAIFSPDDKQIITASEDGSFIIWDTKTGQQIVRQFFFDEDKPLTLLPNGYYMASPEATKLLYYIKDGDKTIGFDQLDIKYNRPDKVLEALGEVFGNPDMELIESYRKAYEKRIKKLGIDPTSFNDDFSVPESDFKNRDEIAYDQTANKLTLKVWGKDEQYKIDRYNIWVNNVPVFGEKGINVRNKNLNEINENITIELSDGENKIETSVLNVNGIESYRQPLYVRYEPKEPAKEKLYFVGIGVDKYQQSENNLQYSAKDIKDLSQALKEKYGDNIEVITLLDEQVTKENVAAVKKTLMNSSVNDKVIISFSGHGLLDKEFDYYLGTNDIDFNNPQKRGLSYETLEGLLDGIPARKKLLMIDACHSGEVDKEDLRAIQETNKQPGMKGAVPVAYKGSGLGLKNSFELMQEIFVNVGRGTGATIISASGGTQFAYEKAGLDNGVFTYSILELMNQQDEIKVSELKEKVGERVLELTNGNQKPTSRNENIDYDWRVW